jgi:hypothetical protein
MRDRAGRNGEEPAPIRSEKSPPERAGKNPRHVIELAYGIERANSTDSPDPTQLNPHSTDRVPCRQDRWPKLLAPHIDRVFHRARQQPSAQTRANRTLQIGRRGRRPWTTGSAPPALLLSSDTGVINLTRTQWGGPPCPQPAPCNGRVAGSTRPWSIARSRAQSSHRSAQGE